MRIAVKVGTSTIAHATGRLNIRRVEALCTVLSDLKNAGHEIILISSGAIGLGVGKLGLGQRPSDLAGKQAAAAVGQCELMYTYDRLFGQYSHVTAQLLLTWEDFTHSERSAHLRNTLRKLLDLGALPIINENDAVATEEISVGDNDTLGALVAIAVQADLLVLLSDIDGLYTADPRANPGARLIHEVHVIDEAVKALAGGSGSQLGTGGMATKVHAAELTCAQGIDLIIAQGAKPELLYDIADGKPVGTRFVSGGKAQ